MTLGEKLRKARKENKLSVNQVAKICDITAATIYNYERNINKIPTKRLIQLAKIYNKDISYFTNKTKIKNKKKLNTSEKLKEARIENGLTVKDVSELTNIPEGTISGYESKKDINISYENLEKLAKIYNKDLNYFLLNKNEKIIAISDQKAKERFLKILFEFLSSIFDEFTYDKINKKEEIMNYIYNFISKKRKDELK